MKNEEENLFEFEEKRMSDGFFPKVHKVNKHVYIQCIYKIKFGAALLINTYLRFKIRVVVRYFRYVFIYFNLPNFKFT